MEGPRSGLASSRCEEVGMVSGGRKAGGPEVVGLGGPLSRSLQAEQSPSVSGCRCLQPWCAAFPVERCSSPPLPLVFHVCVVGKDIAGQAQVWAGCQEAQRTVV